MLTTFDPKTPDEQKNFLCKIKDLMSEGKYKAAAEDVLQYAEDLATKKEALKQSDCIASTYRDLLSLASNKKLRKMHKIKEMQKADRDYKIREIENAKLEIKNNLKNFLIIYEDLRDLYSFNYLNQDNFFDPATEIKSFLKGENLYQSKDHFFQDIFRLLSHIEPVSSNAYLFENRFLKKPGTRYKCERGYDEAVKILNEIESLESRCERAISKLPNLASQEIYLCCGVDVANRVYSIIERIKESTESL